MKNPLNKRFARELKSEFGKYAVIFLFILAMISAVSGFIVANSSIAVSNDEGFEKYKIEDGNFELATKPSDKFAENIENDNFKIYENFYKDLSINDGKSELRIFKNRQNVNITSISEGEFPQAENEIAIANVYAWTNGIDVGDSLMVDGENLVVVGLVALPDYSSQFSSQSEMMFDLTEFGVAIMSESGFDSLSDGQLHYSYSWVYNEGFGSDLSDEEKADNFLQTLGENAFVEQNSVINFVPAFRNQAITLIAEDLKNDSMIEFFLYLAMAVIAFIFVIITSSTIAKESTVIGTLRASGYTKNEILRHYMVMPLLVTLIASIVGNVLGYTVFKNIFARMYYTTFSIPKFETHFNFNALIRTTILPFVILFTINYIILRSKLNLTPLKFIRRELNRKARKKALRLNSKISIIKRFRLRIIFQNMPNYLTIFIGIFFANFVLLFGLVLQPLVENYEQMITENMISKHQYILKAPMETSTDGAEKILAKTLKTTQDGLKSEGVTIYGVADNSNYVKLDFENKIYISKAFAEKFSIEKGEKITLKEAYGTEEFEFFVDEISDYPASISIFMSEIEFAKTFETGFFNGYFSDNKIEDIDESLIMSEITQSDLTKITRQIKKSLGPMQAIFFGFGVLMFMLIVYLLSKIIIEKNAQAISMTKILGYLDYEINSLYVKPTTIVVLFSIVCTLPIAYVMMAQFMPFMLSAFSGWLPYYVPFSTFVKMTVLGAVSYFVVAFLQMRKVKNIPMNLALKIVE